MVSSVSLFTSGIMTVGVSLLSTAVTARLQSPSSFGLTLDDVDLPTVDDLRVQGLDRIVPAYASFEGQMFAGSLPIDHESFSPGANPDGQRTGHYQFWLFVPDHPTVPGTMVSWFNGGPGCSSFATGNLIEHGPVTVPLHPAGWCCEGAHEPLQYNPYSWTNATVMLYIEQPVGVGFSEATNETPPPSSEDDVAADMDAFLQNLYKVFGPDSEVDLTPLDFHLVGESYAGTYIPSIARGIYLRNLEGDQDESIGRIHVPLKGMAIGNGVMDALTQAESTIDWCYWHGMIDGPTRDYLHTVWDKCMSTVNPKDGEISMRPFSTTQDGISDKNDEYSLFHSFNIRDDCGVFDAILRAAGDEALKGYGGPNMYEYSTWDPWAAGQGDKGTVGSFYNDVDVQKALNVPSHRQGKHWRNCIPEEDRRRRLFDEGDNKSGRDPVVVDDRAHQARRRLYMDNDTPWSVIPYIKQLLDDAMIDVLIYSGDRDIICNTQGAEEALRKMKWSGNKDDGWTHAKRSLWVYDDYPAGYIKSYKNLQLLTVYNAGHMVPYNQPGPALNMIERYLKKKSFHDRPLLALVPPDYDGDKIESINHKRSKPSAFETEVKAQASIVGGSGATLLPPSGTMLLTVTVAFFVGFGVALFSARAPSITAGAFGSRERDGYGSIASCEE